MLKLAVKNASFSGISSLANFILSFLFAGFTIRLLGVQRAGYFITIQGLFVIGSSLGGFGLITPAIRKITLLYSEDKYSEIRSCLGSVLYVYVMSGIVITIILIIGYPWVFRWSKIGTIFYHEAFISTILLGISFLFQQQIMVLELPYTSFQRFDIIALLTTIFGLLSGGLGLLTLYFFPTMIALAILSVILSVIRLVIDIKVINKLTRGIIWPRWNYGELKGMAIFGGWVYLEKISSLLANTFDKIILTTYLGSSAVPYYSIGQSLVQQVHTALAGLTQFIFPMLTATRDQMDAIRHKIEDRLRWFVGFVSAIIYSSLALLAYPILTKIVGDSFAGKAIVPFLFACLQGFIVSHNIVPYYINWAKGHGKPNTVVHLINGILVFVTTIILTSRFGIIGASISQLWVGLSTLILIIWATDNIHKFNIKYVLRPLLSPSIIFIVSLTLGGLLWLIHVPLISYYTIFVLSLIFTVMIGIIIERFLFPGYGCLDTVKDAISILIKRENN